MVDRIGSTPRSLGTPDRQPPLPILAGPIPAGRGRDGGGPVSDFPLAPVTPAEHAATVGLLLDATEGFALPQGGIDGLPGGLATDMPDGNDPAAMRPNQLFMSRQMVWHAPDSSTMAGSWHIMVRTYAEQRAALLQQAGGQHLPASLFMTENVPNPLRDGRSMPPMVTELEPWRFAVYAWGAEKLVLKVIIKEGEHGTQARRRRPRIALRLELMLPGFGRVLLQMEPAGGSGVVLEVAAQQTAAMQHMREMLPQLASTVGKIGLSIVRCRLMRELPPPNSDTPYPSQLEAAGLSQLLFKAMAELAVLLSQPLPPEEFFVESA